MLFAPAQFVVRVRMTRPDAGRMRKSHDTLDGVLRGIANGETHSSLYHFLLAYHDEIIAAATGARMPWGTLCREFNAKGLTDAVGKPVSPAVARQTWYRVRKAMVRLRARGSAKPDQIARHPSRMSSTWRPEVVVPQPASRSATATLAPRSSGPDMTLATPSSAEAEQAFSTIGLDGQPLAPGLVLYEGKVMRRGTAEQVARMNRTAEQADRSGWGSIGRVRGDV